MTETRIDITAKDSTKAAFGSVDRSLSTLSGSVSKLTGLVGALGVGFSAVGAISAIKGVIDTNDALAKMSQSTGIAVESLAGLEFASSQSGTSLERTAKGVRAFSKIVLESSGGTDKYSRIIRALGLDLNELKEATPEEQFIKLAGALKDNVSEQERAAVVTSLLGDRYAELVPLLSQGEAGLRGLIAEGKELNPVTAESAKKSEEFNDSLDKLGRSFDAIKVEAAASILPALNSITKEMLEATKQSGFLVGALTGIGEAAKQFFESDFFLGIVGATGPLGALLKTRVEANKAAEALKDIEDQADKTADALEDIDRAAPKSINHVLKEIEEKSGSASKSAKNLTKQLTDEQREAAAVEKEIRSLTLAYDPLIKRNEELARLTRLLNAGLSQNVFDAAAKSAIEEYIRATEGVNEATKDVKKSTDDLGDTGQRVFESMSEFAIQGARSIQTALSDALLSGVDSFKDFADSALDIIKRLASNIASVKLLEGLGIGGLLGLGSTSAVAGSTNFAGGFSNAFGVGSLFSGGGLANSFATSGLGGALGLSSPIGGAAGGLPILTNAGSAFTAGAGTVFSTAAAGALGIGIGSAIAGDKEVFGSSGTMSSAIGAGIGAGAGAFFGSPALGAAIGGALGGVVNKVFGRGPLEKQNARLLGDVDASGFSGVVNTRFKANGSLLRSSKTDNVILDTDSGDLLNSFKGLRESGISSKLLPFVDDAREQILEIGKVLDTTIQGFNQNLRGTAEVLGLSTQSLDGFSRSIDLVSEKGEFLSEQQIAQTLSDVGDHMANVLLPGLQDMVRDGETAVDALNRLKGEFLSLEDALIVFGVSAKDANAAISALSIATRTELVDAAGGIGSLNSQVTFFANNFLTAQEQLDIGFASLDAEMQKLGLSADITVEEFKNLIISVTQAGGASVELASALLQLAPTFLNVKNAEAQLAAEATAAAPPVSNLAGSVSGLGTAAANTAATVQASFARIDTARVNLKAAEQQLVTTQARSALSDAQNQLSAANSTLSTARSNLSAAQNAEQSRISGEINEVISGRNELINTYQQEASALKGVVDRFGALSDKILDFKDSLNIGNLSPFSRGEQLAIARQDFNVTRGLAAQGDERALDRLPEVSRTFLEASQTFNGATGAFESDFNFVQQVLELSGATARATRDIASEQLAGIEGTIEQLQALNEATQSISRGIGQVNDSVMSVEDAMAAVEKAANDVEAAQADVDNSTRAVENALFVQNGFIDDVGQATIQVRDAVIELTQAMLQGFGNPNISDAQIRDFVAVNPNLSAQELTRVAVENSVSAAQFQRATGASFDVINRAIGGLSVADQQIADFVTANISNPFAIYQAAIANGISSDRLAAGSILSKEEIDQFVRANNLQPFETGTDFVRKDGIAMLHKGEAVVPSSTTEEIKKLREELAELRREQNQQMSALINTNIQANADNAQAIAKSNEKLAVNANWQNRSRPKVA